jgi:hypothetical protein
MAEHHKTVESVKQVMQNHISPPFILREKVMPTLPFRHFLRTVSTPCQADVSRAVLLKL